MVVATILVVKVIKLLNKVNKITTSVEETTQNIHDVIKGVKSVVTPAVITNAVTSWVNKFTNKSKKEDK
jgi:hypothetical protein